MNLTEKVKLSRELTSIRNALSAGIADLRERVEKAKRLTEIRALLGARDKPATVDYHAIAREMIEKAVEGGVVPDTADWDRLQHSVKAALEKAGLADRKERFNVWLSESTAFAKNYRVNQTLNQTRNKYKELIPGLVQGAKFAQQLLKEIQADPEYAETSHTMRVNKQFGVFEERMPQSYVIAKQFDSAITREIRATTDDLVPEDVTKDDDFRFGYSPIFVAATAIVDTLTKGSDETEAESLFNKTLDEMLKPERRFMKSFENYINDFGRDNLFQLIYPACKRCAEASVGFKARLVVEGLNPYEFVNENRKITEEEKALAEILKTEGFTVDEPLLVPKDKVSEVAKELEENAYQLIRQTEINEGDREELKRQLASLETKSNLESDVSESAVNRARNRWDDEKWEALYPVRNVKLSDLLVKGRLWEKSGHSRTYLNLNQAGKAAGWKINAFKDTVRSIVDPRGIELMQSDARRMWDSISDGTYYNNKTKTLENRKNLEKWLRIKIVDDLNGETSAAAQADANAADKAVLQQVIDGSHPKINDRALEDELKPIIERAEKSGDKAYLALVDQALTAWEKVAKNAIKAYEKGNE